MLNAGQICTNVDYLFLPEDRADEFVAEAKRCFNHLQPDINSGDYTAIIDQRSYDRLQATAQDAEAKGARLVDLYDGPPADALRRIMAPRLVLGATEDMEVMQREIFGPLLPVLTYRDPQEVLAYVNARPRPLAFYLYSNDAQLQQHYLNNTISGGVGINDAVVQAGLHDLPFGGTGNSGMGHYHGYEGFLTFSKLRPVFRQGPLRGLDLLRPPYRGWPERLLKLMSRLVR
jgi:coniferyl-aldehyde dehydrogenase